MRLCFCNKLSVCCTSQLLGDPDVRRYYELEADEYARKGISLTPDLWLTKLLIGAVDPTYDEQVAALLWPSGTLLHVLTDSAVLQVAQVYVTPAH